MKAEAFRLLQSLFEEALQRPRGEREAWVATACGRDVELRDSLIRLLAVEEASASELEDALVGQLGAASQAITERAWATGARVGRYRIVGEIGRGGMGRVYAAVFEEGGIGRDVAIKVLHRDTWSEGLARRFLRERRLLAALQHPGIARLLDVGETPDGEPYLVMDLVQGDPITRFAQRHALGIAARLELFLQVLRAVSHAHRNLILHRDIKPNNVMVDGDGRVRLLDFGIAKMVGVEEDLTALHGAMLTPTYASPEHLDSAESGVASDVYSLGVLLYELLTGDPPFQRDGQSSGAFEKQVREVPPPPLVRAFARREDAGAILGIRDTAAWAKEIAGDVDAIVQKALRKSPEERYASVDAFDADVVALLDRRPVSARSGKWSYRLRLFMSRHRLAMAAAGAVFAVTVFSAGAFVRQAAEVRRERDRAAAAVSVLRESFTAADPLRTAGEPTPARGVLEGAGQRLLPLLANDPDTYLPVAIDLAETQLSLGLLSDAAAGWIERAMATPVADPELRHRRDLVLATVAIVREDTQQASRLIRGLKARDSGDRRTIVLEARLAILESREDDAIRLLTPLWEAGLADERDLVEAAWSLAETLRLRERAEEARPILERVLAMQVASDSSTRPDAVVTMIRLASVEVELGRISDAITRLGEAESLAARYFGTLSTTFASLQATKARALSAEGKYASAADAFLIAADAYAATLGPTHRNAIRSRFNQAQTLAFVPERVGDALALYAVVEEMARTTMSTDDPLLAFIRIQWAGALVRDGRWDDARVVLVTLTKAPSRGEPLDPERIESLVVAILAEGTGCRSTAPPGATASVRIIETSCGK